MGTAIEVKPLVKQDDGGDDWCGVTEWGHELYVQRWDDSIVLCDGFNKRIDLSAAEAIALGNILVAMGRKLKA